MEDHPKSSPVADRVAKNIKELRGRMPVRELSRSLEAIGRPIHASGITKIEMGTRRVDADDLVALAIALGVTPNRILLDRASDEADIQLAQGHSVTRRHAWNWANGRMPLPPVLKPQDDMGRELVNVDAMLEFRRINRPNEKGFLPSLDDPETVEALRPVSEAARQAVDRGAVTIDEVIEYLKAFGPMMGGKSAVSFNDPDPKNS
jgi:transcriptional regulator with XRE-family HTH domain